MSVAGKKIIAGLEEALRFARGEDTGAIVHHVEVSDVSMIRNKLQLSQKEFADRFGVSIGTLRNWEQGVRLPEGPARILLRVIEREPEAVRRALTLPAKVSKAGEGRTRKKTAKPKRKRA